MMNNTRAQLALKLWVMLGMVFLLGACGYHLKGQHTLPDSIQFVRLSSGNAPVAFTQVLEQELTRAGAVLVDTLQETKPENENQTVLTVSNFSEDNRQRQGTEYALTLRANVSVTGATQDRTVRAQYIYTKDDNNPLANTQVVNNARARLYKELAQNIVNTLAYAKAP